MSSEKKSFRILYLEPSYSSLFRDLNTAISPEWSHTLLFSLGYFTYLPTRQFTFVSLKLKANDLNKKIINIVQNIPSIANSNSRSPSSKEVNEMASFYEYLHGFLISNRINLVVCHNDLRWQHAIAKHICQELNIKILFFEEGYFRPNTITVDASGVNAFSSLPRKSDFYLRFKSTPKAIKSFSKTPHLFRILRIVRFNKFLLLNTLGSFLKLNTYNHNKEYSFVRYLSLFASKLRIEFFQKNKFPNNYLPLRYIFVALQVTEDTQTVIHSPYSGTQEFIREVENAFFSIPESLRKDVQLIFKKHPMESSKPYSFAKESIISYDDTNYLIKGSLGVVLINSSTIAQCLKLNKPVISLGDSFFDIKGMTHKCNGKNLPEALTKLILGELKTNNELCHKFLEYLQYEYQYNMNLYYYNNEDLIKFVGDLNNRELGSI